MTFQDLKIIHPILKALETQGYKTPSPIQEQAIPPLLEGKDLLGSAQTGTGKTAAFAIPIIQGINQNKDHQPKRVIKALIMAPTRELAEQIKDSFKKYGSNLNIKTEAVYGGVSQRPQEAFLRNGIDVLVATPGRLWDLMRQGRISLASIKYLVLDEADNMLDMGFIDTVKKIVAKIPSQHQTMLFSATIPEEILDLAKTLLKDPVRVSINPEKRTVDKIDQTVYFVHRTNKTKLLTELMVDNKITSALIFTRTKRGADKLEKEMIEAGFKVGAIHGNKSQSKRNYVLKSFKDHRIQALIATDVAARGLDISNLSHVVNYDLPETAETYIHRMGRTGRAGLTGKAYSLCSQEELYLLRMIERHIKQPVKIEHDHKYVIEINKNDIRNPYKPHNQKKQFNRGNDRRDNQRRDFKRSDRPDFKRSDRPDFKRSDRPSFNRNERSDFSKSVDKTQDTNQELSQILSNFRRGSKPPAKPIGQEFETRPRRDFKGNRGSFGDNKNRGFKKSFNRDENKSGDSKPYNKDYKGGRNFSGDKNRDFKKPYNKSESRSSETRSYGDKPYAGKAKSFDSRYKSGSNYKGGYQGSKEKGSYSQGSNRFGSSKPRSSFKKKNDNQQ